MTKYLIYGNVISEHTNMAWNDWIPRTKFHRPTVNVTALQMLLLIGTRFTLGINTFSLVTTNIQWLRGAAQELEYKMSAKHL